MLKGLTRDKISSVDVGAHDEIFQNGELVLVGCDVHSTYIYLLSLVPQQISLEGLG